MGAVQLVRVCHAVDCHDDAGREEAMKHGPSDRTLPPKPDVPNTSWWITPEVQKDRAAFDQAQAERAKQSWGQFGAQAAIVRILE
jgi:hypothetical protein